MAIRSVARRATVLGINAHPSAAPIYVDSDDNVLKIVPAGTGSTEVPLVTSLVTSGARMTAGTGTLVTGSIVVATGLATVLGFVATIEGNTGNTATGVTEVEYIRVTSITTGAVSCLGLYHSADASITIASASGTATFRWIAFGT